MAAGSVAIGGAFILPHLFAFDYKAFRAVAAPAESIDIPRGWWRMWTVSGSDTMLLPTESGGWKLHVRHHFGAVEYEGAEARRFRTVLLAHVNGNGASTNMIRRAIGVLQQRNSEEMLRAIADRSAYLCSPDALRQREYYESHGTLPDGKFIKSSPGGLSKLSTPQRFALDMALHEGTEQAPVAAACHPQSSPLPLPRSTPPPAPPSLHRRHVNESSTRSRRR